MRQSTTLQELKDTIVEEISAIQPEMLESDFYNLKERLVILHQQNKDHIKHLK